MMDRYTKLQMVGIYFCLAIFLTFVLLPFFAFNYYYYFVVPVLTEVGLLDFVGNTIMIALCWHGWRVAPE